MKQISNKTLMMLLVASIAISIVGTISNIKQIDTLVSDAPAITGFAGSGTGKINFTVASVTQISVTDGVLDFGSCSPNTTGTYLASNDSNESWGAVDICTIAGVNKNTTDSLNVSNEGNDDVNITVSTNLLAGDFLGGTSPQMMFIVRNVTARPGCTNTSNTGTFNDTMSNTTGMQWLWMNFSSTGYQYPVCENLTYPDTKDSFAIYVRIFIPSDVIAGGGEKNVTYTFTATSI